MKHTALDFISGKVHAEDLYEERISLGLNKKAKDKFNSKSMGDVVEELNEVTYDDILNLYKKYGKIQPDYQLSLFGANKTLTLNELKIGKSYSKFINDLAGEEYYCRFTNNWGEEGLSAIEFWKAKPDNGKRRVLSNRLYGEEKYFIEIRNDFFTNKKNFILDWLIPATLNWLEKTPNARHYFLRDKVNESRTALGLNNQAKKKFNDTTEDAVEALDISEDIILQLYDKYGSVTTKFQDIRGPIKNPSENMEYRMIFEEISESYRKFILDMTDGTIVFSSTVYLYRERRIFYSAETKDIEYEETNEPREFNKILWKNGNIIIDGYIPSTMKWLNAHPEHIPGFLRRL